MTKDAGFFEKVYYVAAKIPRGRVTSYGAIARFLGSPQSARMVGWAMNASKEKSDVPAHRVVNRNGLLTGKSHFSGTHAMQQLLEEEGVAVRDLKIQDFGKHFWDPGKELNTQE
ncbi:MGMT family protein [Salegentibacter sp. F188]|uniref:MGMT family protein n=1 Tax=Autumnicola patrickiae TaxID=3075591 RepID=A0ABU3E475_9FLAO|nr:MGMT family protein [Salegentibacter sp. F188]MDT0690700.1 MGMT family protein [Salegentibacter sp. F188]